MEAGVHYWQLVVARVEARDAAKHPTPSQQTIEKYIWLKVWIVARLRNPGLEGGWEWKWEVKEAI